MASDICPRCKRRMGLDWMGETEYSMKDGSTRICDVCFCAENLEAGVLMNDLAKFGSQVKHSAVFDGEQYWSE